MEKVIWLDKLTRPICEQYGVVKCISTICEFHISILALFTLLYGSMSRTNLINLIIYKGRKLHRIYNN